MPRVGDRTRELWELGRRASVAAPDADNVAATVNSLTTRAFLLGYDGTAFDRLRVVYPTDDFASPTGTLSNYAFPSLYNGASWDRQRNNTEFTLLASATRTTTTATGVQTNYNARGVMLFLNISARTGGASPLIDVRLRTRDPVSVGKVPMVSTGNFDPVTRLHIMIITPGAQAVALGTLGGDVKLVAGLGLPRQWDVLVAFVQDVTSLTYSLGGCYLL